ncbi:MAG: hypothetical protein SGJ23_00780 [Alphaproteobacteria bacterium]|nr:hypothetical protein [Alphaproteobacteria bacterium]
MTDAIKPANATPWHFWAVVVLGLLWNGFGVFNFYGSMTMDDAALQAAGMTAAQIDYFRAMPGWTTVAYAVGTIGALIGTILLLLRSKWAMHVFALSLAGFLATRVYMYALSDGATVMPSFGIDAAILAGCVFFLWYAWSSAKNGLLR